MRANGRNMFLTGQTCISLSVQNGFKITMKHHCSFQPNHKYYFRCPNIGSHFTAPKNIRIKKNPHTHNKRFFFCIRNMSFNYCRMIEFEELSSIQNAILHNDNVCARERELWTDIPNVSGIMDR